MMLGARTAAWSGKQLPYDYKVEYLEVADNNCGLVLDFCPLSNICVSACFSVASFDVPCFANFGTDYSGAHLWHGVTIYANKFYYGTDGRELSNGVAAIGEFYDISYNFSLSDFLVVNNVTVASSEHFATVPSNASRATLFYRWATMGGAEKIGTIGCKCKYYKAFDRNSGNLVCNLVPCVKDGVAKFYDAVSGNFYTANKGSGHFIAGPRI